MLLAVVAVYGVAYRALVQVGTATSPNRRTHPIQFHYYEPTYRYGGGTARVAFWPANWIDRRLRDEQWAKPVWKPRHWSYSHHPRGQNFSYEPSREGVRFHVQNANVVQVWTMTFAPAIDVAARPILTVRYRARNTDPEVGWYMLWIDDGTGPNSGGITAVGLSEIRGDDRVREIRRDLRGFNPQGDLFYFAVGVASGPEGSAVFDLLEIRFEPEHMDYVE